MYPVVNRIPRTEEGEEEEEATMIAMKSDHSSAKCGGLFPASPTYLPAEWNRGLYSEWARCFPCPCLCRVARVPRVDLEALTKHS